MSVLQPLNLEPNRVSPPPCRRPFRRGALFAAAVLPFLLGAADSFEERYERIRKMTAVERAVLQHNFETFKSMPEADRAKYRELNRLLYDDVKGDGRQLAQVMDNYVKWLGTLSPVQRGELRSVTDPNEKLALVHRFQAEQERQRSTPPLLPGLFGGRDGPRPMMRLQPDDFAAVMQVIEGTLPPDDKRRLADEPPHRRHLLALERVVQLHKARGVKFPEEETQQKMIAAIRTEQVRENLEAIKQPEWRRTRLCMQLFAGLQGEWFRELESHKPPEAELKAFFQNLSPEQHRMLPKDGRMMSHELLWMYLSQKDPVIGADLKKIRGLIEQFRGEDPRPGERRQPPLRPNPERAGRPGADRPGNGDGPRPERRPGEDRFERPPRRPE